jgi:hypothetical protein
MDPLLGGSTEAVVVQVRIGAVLEADLKPESDFVKPA